MALGLESQTAQPDALQNLRMRFARRRGLGGFSGAGMQSAGAGGPIGRGRGQQLLGDADRAGLFNPNGPSSAFFDPIRSEAVASQQARTKQATLAASLFGRGDPSMRGFAQLQSTLGGASDLARTIGAARAQASGDNLNFYRDLFRDFSGTANRGGFA